GERLLRGEDRLGDPRGEIAAGLRGARLHEDRPTLRRARHAERPGDAEVLTLVVDRVDALGGGEDPRLLVADQRVVLPAVPEGRRRLDELGRPLVAPGVLGAAVAAEVAGLV